MNKDSKERARREYYRARADNIKKKVNVYDILNYYDIPIRTENAEVQFPCPLHGDGRDMGFSARAYPEEEDQLGGGTYCFGCHKSRDVIGWVKDKESVTFTEAMKIIEQNFNIAEVPSIYDYFNPSAITDEDLENKEGGIPSNQLEKELSEILDKKVSKKKNFSFIGKKIDRLIDEKKDKISLEAATKMYYIYDSVFHDLEEGKIEEDDAENLLKKLMLKIQELSAK